MPSEPSARADPPADTVALAARHARRVASVRRDPASDHPGQPNDANSLAHQQGQLIGFVADALDEASFHAAATTLVTRLAGTFQCERVSLGVCDGERIDVAALSNTVEFEASAGLVRDIRRAMAESKAQRCTIRYPATGRSPVVDSAHAALTRLQGGGSVLSVPLVVQGAVFGVITLESFTGPVADQTVVLAERVSLIVSPILKLKRDLEVPVTRRLGQAASALVGKAIGPRHLLGKCLLVALLALIGVAVSTDAEHRVVADASLEARDVHAVVSPARGYISKILKRAGDVVDEGTALAQLDDRDLAVELEKWRTELSKNNEEQHAALAARDRQRSRMLKLQEQQIRAQVRLVENLMDRGNLVSPVRGIVNSVDPNHSYGSPIERGELLFEIAPLSGYRLILQVDEADIPEVEPGQVGRLVLSGRPFEPLAFTVRNVVPLSVSSEGRNRFRVEADLADAPDWIRPGMLGVAKVSVGERRIAWIWTHRLVEALQLTFWRWGWT